MADAPEMESAPMMVPPIDLKRVVVEYLAASIAICRAARVYGEGFSDDDLNRIHKAEKQMESAKRNIESMRNG